MKENLKGKYLTLYTVIDTSTGEVAGAWSSKASDAIREEKQKNAWTRLQDRRRAEGMASRYKAFEFSFPLSAGTPIN